jgi:hypothetical protein
MILADSGRFATDCSLSRYAQRRIINSCTPSLREAVFGITGTPAPRDNNSG